MNPIKAFFNLFNFKRALADLAVMDGNSARARGDHTEAWLHYLRAAYAGVPEGAYNLGIMRLSDESGLPVDYSEAARWFRQAAEAGLPEAQHNLGLLYERGDGVPQNIEEAMKWLKMAAEQGSARSAQRLARWEKGLALLEEQAKSKP
jgi:TPR repeat protein